MQVGKMMRVRKMIRGHLGRSYGYRPNELHVGEISFQTLNADRI
jgi:hypothetical protein